MYCKHYVNLHGGILQKITNRTDCSYFHKKEITGEYIYSGSVHSENLPNQKWIFARMFFGPKLVLKYWYKKLIHTLKCGYYYGYQRDIWLSLW